MLAFSLALGHRRPAGERPVSVEILTQRQFEAMTAPPPVAAPAPLPTPTPSALPTEPPVEPPPEAMVRPREMLSAGTLADPRSREARALLSTLDDTERMIQLCGLEAMEQVHAWRDTLHPTAVVAYAMEDAVVSGDRVDAGGAAFRSGEAWYGLSFECRLEPDHTAVAAFAFKVGAAVPAARWEALSLPAEAGIDSD